MFDPDPNTWDLPTTRTITLSTDGRIFTTVDIDNYYWLLALGPWHLYNWDGKLYAKRTRRKGERGPVSIYMHRVIMLRHGPPPSKTQSFVDHRNGDGLWNLEKNLRWVTPKQNRWNIFGQMQFDLELHPNLSVPDLRHRVRRT